MNTDGSEVPGAGVPDDEVRGILHDLVSGAVDIDGAVDRLTRTGYIDLGFARLDPRRDARSVLPEIVFGQGKTGEQLAVILRRLHRTSGLAVASRIDASTAGRLADALPDGTYHETARIFALGEPRAAGPDDGVVAVVTAGTSDIPVAEEAAVVLELMGTEVRRYFDVGVAGIHRLAGVIDGIRECAACIVVAGMDAALPSVLGGLLRGPVIGVPTSTGYGAAFGGVSGLLSILNSCSPGVVAVNIDNGVGGAAAALRVVRGRTRAERN